MFGKLRVWDTEHNNGVLVYVLLAEHAIEIVADRGLRRHVDDNHWQTVVAHMASGSSAKRATRDGLTQALENLGGAGRPFPLPVVQEQPTSFPCTPLLQ
jgi:uncharacterized membrane protein